VTIQPGDLLYTSDGEQFTVVSFDKVLGADCLTVAPVLPARTPKCGDRYIDSDGDVFTFIRRPGENDNVLHYDDKNNFSGRGFTDCWIEESTRIDIPEFEPGSRWKGLGSVMVIGEYDGRVYYLSDETYTAHCWLTPIFRDKYTRIDL
jgi:hypothetical protein